MTRPSLTPLTYAEFDRPKMQPMRFAARNLRQLLRGIVGFFGQLVSLAFTMDLRTDHWRKRLPMRLILIGAVTKSAWLVPIIVGACAWVVYQKTHAPRLPGDPIARVQGAFSERVAFETSDGVLLSGVWVPAIRAQDVIERADAILTERRPAVLLVHDHGQDATQMLGHAGLIHQMGAHVLVLDTRGRGQSETAAQTFGHLERLDVAAAVDYLASRPTVDKDRIAVWAVGTGVRAAEMAPSAVAPAMLLAQENPYDAQRAGMDIRFLPDHKAYDLFRPVCRWTFHVLFMRGPAEQPPHPPRHVVELPEGDLKSALGTIEAFASNSLVATSN